MITVTDRGPGEKDRQANSEKVHGLRHVTIGGQHCNEDTLMSSLMASPTGPQGYKGKYNGTPVSATQARHDVEMILSTWHMEHLREPAAQIIAELMANAVSHCHTAPVALEMLRTSQGVRICVVDSCHKAPAPRDAAPTDENGRGMLIIAAFASRWDWEFIHSGRRKNTIGKRVWADIDL